MGDHCDTSLLETFPKEELPSVCWCTHWVCFLSKGGPEGSTVYRVVSKHSARSHCYISFISLSSVCPYQTTSKVTSRKLGIPKKEMTFNLQYFFSEIHRTEDLQFLSDRKARNYCIIMEEVYHASIRTIT